MRLFRRAQTSPDPEDSEPRDPPESDWQYYRLRDLQILGTPSLRYAHLLCEDDECGSMILATCRGRYFTELEPLARQLLDWKDDPVLHEQPIIPLRRDADRYVFPPIGPAAAMLPCPHLSYSDLTNVSPTSQILFQAMTKPTEHQGSPAFLITLLKSASRFG